MLLKRRAQELVSLADKTAKEMMGADEAITGEISIGFGETMNVEVIAELMNAFRSQYPDVYFTFHTANADDVKERIERGILDFGMLLEPVEISRYSFISMPCRDDWTALVRRDHPLAAKEVITPADLVGEPLLIPTRDVVKNMLHKCFGPYQEDMNIVAYLNLSAWNKRVFALHRSGIGLGLRHYTKCPELIEIPLSPPIENSAALVWKKNEFVSPTIERFIEFAQEFIPAYQPVDTSCVVHAETAP